MKRILFLTVLLIPFLSAFAQVEHPIKWDFSKKKISENKYELKFHTTITPGWHVYSLDLPEGGPVPTSINYEDEKIFVNKEDFKESPKPETHYDSAFNMDLSYWAVKSADVIQVVTVKPGTKVISGYVEFMTCDDHRCLPPDQIDFKFALSDVKTVAKTASTKAVNAGSKSDKKEIANSADSSPGAATHGSYWSIFLLAFLGGLAALLTPCVFPMIPMTVSFFTKQSKTKMKGIRNAIQYGIFIIFIYVVLGWAVVLIFGADALNALSTNPWFNIFFFLLLAIFAISFLGAFEIVLPSKWVNKADKGVDKGGLIGSFFMALTLALVSFSCTGPIVGALLVAAASSGGMAPLIGMFGFSLALAIPFTLFAMFPGYLNSLPKSGGWLNSVKVVLGFVELALAFKFLSNADLVLDTHLLEREVYIAIWIVISGALAMYLFGKLTLPNDSPIKSLGVGRLLLGLLVGAFTIYMIPGMWGAPLKLISAFPPPMEYAESPQGVGYRANNSVATAVLSPSVDATLEAKRHLGPQGLQVFHDYDDALKYAKLVHKPVFIDFTGKACVNCRQMEINVWSDPEVKALMQNKFVVVSLFVDFREKLDKPYTSPTTGKTIRTVGNKNSDFEISRFKINSQPYYALVDTDGKVLNHPRGYTPDIPTYINWMKDALSMFKK